MRITCDRIPLNDDAQEKGQRMNNRKALQEKQINEIKRAATPRRSLARLEDLENASQNGTPRGGRGILDDEDPIMVGGVSVTPMKRVPLLANFEEWMKMATDNKINATNSWNFALIDYFHDMSLLKEGDGVNFQKASCTLDGCVKIYTNRIDSVATETGKLLSGLADSNNKKKDRDAEDGAAEGEESEEEVDENGNVKKKTKKKVTRAWAWTSKVVFFQLTDVRHQSGPEIVRSNTSTIVCLPAAQEVRTRICRRSPFQEGVRRLRRGGCQGSIAQPPHDRLPGSHCLRQQR